MPLAPQLSSQAAAQRSAHEPLRGAAGHSTPQTERFEEASHLFALVGEHRIVGRLLADEDRLCAWRATTPIGGAAFLRVRVLAAYACDVLPCFLLADTTLVLVN